MATNFTTIYRGPLMTPGDPAVRNVWGQVCDTWFSLLEQGASGSLDILLVGTAKTLTTANNASDEARPARWNFTGALIGNCTVSIPPVSRVGWATNATTGNRNVILVVSGGGGGGTITITPGSTVMYACNGITLTQINLSTVGLPLSGTTGTFSSALSSASLTTGPLVASTGTFSGQVTASSLAVSGAATVGGNGTFGGSVFFAGDPNFWLGKAAGKNTLDFAQNNYIQWDSTNLIINSTGRIVTSGLNCTSDIIAANTLRAGNGLYPCQTVTPEWTLFSDVNQSAIQFQSAYLIRFERTTGALRWFTPFGAVFSLAPNGDALFTGNLEADAFLTPSDARLKTDVMPISDETGVEFIEQMKPVIYERKGVFEAGFIAQDVAVTDFAHIAKLVDRPGLPERVEANGLTSPANRMFTLSYDQAVPYLVAALRSALDRIAALEAAVRV